MRVLSRVALLLWALFCFGCATDMVVTQGIIAEQKKNDAENAEKNKEEFEKRLEEAQKLLEERNNELNEATGTDQKEEDQ